MLENAQVYGNAVVYESVVSGNAKINEASIIHSKIMENAFLCGRVKIERSTIQGHAILHGIVEMFGANITSNDDFVTVGSIGSRGSITTFYKNKQGGIRVSCGCYRGTIEEFKKRIKAVHGTTFYEYQYNLAIQFAIKLLTKKIV